MLKRGFWRRPETRTGEGSVSDIDIARDLKSRISRELPGDVGQGLRIYVRGGAVTIYGQVAGIEDRQFIKQLARRTPGVVTVFDHVVVGR